MLYLSELDKKSDSRAPKTFGLVHRKDHELVDAKQ